MGCSKRSSKREVYSNTILPQETRKTSKLCLEKNNRTLHLKQLEKEEQKDTKLVEGKKSQRSEQKLVKKK